MRKISLLFTFASLAIGIGLSQSGCGGADALRNERLFILRSTGTDFRIVSTVSFSDFGGDTAITGLNAGDQLVSVDVRPLTGELFGISVQKRLYTINTSTGVATQVGAVISAINTPVEMEFNPSVDRIRVTSNTQDNYRLNPTTGALAATDTSLSFVPGDINVGSTVSLVGLAYTNSINPAPALTTVFGLEDTANALVLLGGQNGTPSPNTGGLTTQAGTVPTISGSCGFDISGETGIGYVLSAGNRIYTINLANGLMTLRNPGLSSGALDITILP